MTHIEWGTQPDEQSASLAPKCPHCQRDWHPEPLTADVVAMLENHHFRADYNPDADESVIRCVGANYLGPNRYSGPWGYISCGNALGIQPGAGWPQIEFDTSQLVKAQGVISNILDSMLGFLGIEMPDLSINFSTWFHGLDPKPECDTLPLPIEFGPQNWSITPPGPSFSIKYGHEPACQTVRDLWDEFTAIPMPESPGYDFSEYASETMDYTTIGKGKK